MKNRISSLSLAVLFSMAAVGPAFAENAAPADKAGVSLSEAKTKKSGFTSSLDSWLKDLRKRVAKTRARQNQVVAVAAVRGSDTEDAPPLYWKGKKSTGPVEEKELAAFESAVEAAINGKPEAKDELKAFITTYPKSPMAGDANAALARLEAVTPAP